MTKRKDHFFNASFLFFIITVIYFFILASCNSKRSSIPLSRGELEIVKVIDAVPLNKPDLYIKTVKDSAKNEKEIQSMCIYILSSGWKQKPDMYSEISAKIDSAYGKKNDTIHLYVMNYGGQNLLRMEQGDSCFHLLQNALKLAEKLNDSLLLSMIYQTLSAVYIMKTQFVQSISMIHKAMDYLPKDKKANLADLKAELANIYARQREHKKAKESMYESFRLAQKYKDSASISLYATHLASAYADLKQADSVLWAAEQAHNIAEKLQDTSLFALIYYYKGVAYNLKGEQTKSLEYAHKALILSEIQQNLWLKNRTNVCIANCYLSLNELDKAKNLYWETFKEQQTKMGIKINTIIGDSLVVLDLKKQGDTQLVTYFRRMRYFMDSTFSAQRASAWEEMNVRYETEKKERQIKELALDKKTAQIQALIIFIVLLLSTSIGTLIIYRNRQQRLLLEKEKAILESSKKLLEANKQLQAQALQEKEREIERNQTELYHFNENILAKNKLIEEMESKMNQLLTNTSSVAKEDLDKSRQALNDMKILTDSDWKTYLNYFDKAKPNFVARVSTHFTDLTQGELRLFLLVNLGFNRKEIADILGISTEGVRKNQYRLKKKLDLSEESSLEEFISKF